MAGFYGNKTELYDFSTDTWTYQEPLPFVETLNSYSTVSMGDSAIIISGFDDGRIENRIFQYKDDLWSVVGTLTKPRYMGASSALTGNTLIVAGGFPEEAFYEDDYSVEVFDEVCDLQSNGQFICQQTSESRIAWAESFLVPEIFCAK